MNKSEGNVSVKRYAHKYFKAIVRSNNTLIYADAFNLKLQRKQIL